ncbi:hypothetical protein D2N39_11935 [Gemmobacter lutimaris]|uniref:DUF7742 domain-containing protein n=1 Tax=Gemmobacter lutimaris TaxID=2306023 RepID=A0A398BL14_9RHOB|nr:hypothetical protein [Gemmobacter lutimaris]RID91409.1 hypothetical protein D2N39_11935 [Gemmobacter lutimaris]
MRAVLPGDLNAAARALMARPRQEWELLADRLIAEAHMAHRIVKRLGRMAPGLGDGSLMSRAMLCPARREAHPSDRAFLAAQEITIRRLLLWYCRMEG